MCMRQLTKQLLTDLQFISLGWINPEVRVVTWLFIVNDQLFNDLIIRPTCAIRAAVWLPDAETHPHMSHLYSRMPRCLFTWFRASPSWAVAKLQSLHMKGLEPATHSTERSHATISLRLRGRNGNFNKTRLHKRWAEIWFYITDHFSMPGMEDCY